jgi:hypothetical protein
MAKKYYGQGPSNRPRNFAGPCEEPDLPEVGVFESISVAISHLSGNAGDGYPEWMNDDQRKHSYACAEKLKTILWDYVNK